MAERQWKCLPTSSLLPRASGFTHQTSLCKRQPLHWAVIKIPVIDFIVDTISSSFDLVPPFVFWFFYSRKRGQNDALHPYSSLIYDSLVNRYGIVLPPWCHHPGRCELFFNCFLACIPWQENYMLTASCWVKATGSRVGQSHISHPSPTLR